MIKKNPLSSGNGNDGGLGKCEGTMVDTVGEMATTREGKGQS